MKKVILIAVGMLFILVSCKKDRVCSCKEIERETYPHSPHFETTTDYDIEMKKVSLNTAFKACVHTKQEYKENDTTTVTVDTNCELK